RSYESPLCPTQADRGQSPRGIVMSARRLPVRPNLDQLKRQAKDLLRRIRLGEPGAIEELSRYHNERVNPASAKLADAQLVLARSYEAPSWPRLVQACKLIDAIWRDDV